MGLGVRFGTVAAVAALAVSLPAAVSPGVVQADPAPHPEKIFATHPPRGEGFITEYVVEWKRGFLEPGPPSDWEWIWTKTHPPGADCGKFNRLGRVGSWEHPHDPSLPRPCPEEKAHEGHIHVWFGKDDNGVDDDWVCIGLYEFGSNAGFGKEEPKCSQPWPGLRSRPDVPQDIVANKERMKDHWTKATWAWGSAGALATAGMSKFPAAAGPLGGFAAFCGVVAIGTGKLAIDPPDSNFRVIARPKTRPAVRVTSGRGFPPAVAASFTRLLNRMGTLETLLRGHLTALERAWGAANARNLAWMRRQQEAAALYARSAAEVALELPALRLRVARAIRASRSTLISAAILRDAQRQIARQGLPASFTAKLRRAGLSPAQIRGARKEVARLRTSGGFADFLTSPNLAAADRQAARDLMQYYTAIYP